MKKIFLLIVCGLLCSCKSITYQDVNPQIAPNKELLPAMEALVDVYNLENTYERGAIVTKTQGYGSGSITTSGHMNASINHSPYSNYTSVSGFYRERGDISLSSSSEARTTYEDDIRVHDVIRIFEKEVEENMTNPYGEKKGFIMLRLGYRETKYSYLHPIASILTLFTINFFGFPSDKVTESLEVEVRIMDKERNLIKKYYVHAKNECICAFWYGYHYKNFERKIAADNIKEALEKIRVQIGRDAAEIKAKLAE